MALSVSEIIAKVNKKHRYLVIFKDGREVKLKGDELKEKLLSGQIRLSELRDIQDLDYDSRVEEINGLEKFLKKVEWRLGSLMKGGQDLSSWFQTILKVIGMLIGLFIVIKVLSGTLGGGNSD